MTLVVRGTRTRRESLIRGGFSAVLDRPKSARISFVPLAAQPPGRTNDRGVAVANLKWFGRILALAIVGIVVGCSSSISFKQGDEELSVPEADYYDALKLGDGGRTTEAIAAWLDIVADEPKFALGHYNVGCLYDSVFDFDKAMESYEQAVRLDPAQAAYHLALGTVYLRRGMTTHAVKELKEAAAKDPFNHYAAYNLSGAYMALKDFDNALLHADRAVDLYAKPGTGESGLAEGVEPTLLAKFLERQAWCHVERGELDKATQCAERIEKQCRDKVPAKLKLKLEVKPAADKPDEKKNG